MFQLLLLLLSIIAADTVAVIVAVSAGFVHLQTVATVATVEDQCWSMGWNVDLIVYCRSTSPSLVLAASFPPRGG